MKKKLLSAAVSLIICLSGMSAEAFVLPHDMQVYLIENSAGATVRFDGLINLLDGEMYIPVVPAQPKEVDKLEVIYTYPKNKTFKDRPDVIVFNNNYSLLRVITTGKKRTITNYDNLPQVVLTGVLPQDMLVPTGFYVSENMKGLLGNLEVPVQENLFDKNAKTFSPKVETTENASKSGKKVVKTHKKVAKTAMPPELDNKMYLVTNFDSQYLKIFAPGRPEPLYGLKLKGVLKDVKVTPDKKYLLTAVYGKNVVDIADIANEQVARTLEIEMQPSEILVDDIAQKAYILSTEGKSIFAVNLKDMTITEKIKLNAVPYRMALSPDGSQLAYGDKDSDTVFVLKIDDEYKNIPVTKCTNISKIILDNSNRMYIISRTGNELLVNDYNLNKPFIAGEENEPKGAVLQSKLSYNTRKMLGVGNILPDDIDSADTSEIEDVTATVEQKKVKTGNKPTEMCLHENKLFIVCSADNIIDVFDTNTLKYTDKIELPFKGFPRIITKIEDTPLAIVTSSDAKKYAIINMHTNKIVGTYPLDMPVHSITIINKIHNINLIEQTL
ncbi:MAG: hypothetical protein K6C94_09375 [Candidatus Gastranaerophilales bacterium]|nr:hypothetical protein [Candidatus Gastranaerophilales bacterium]